MDAAGTPPRRHASVILAFESTLARAEPAYANKAHILNNSRREYEPLIATGDPYGGLGTYTVVEVTARVEGGEEGRYAPGTQLLSYPACSVHAPCDFSRLGGREECTSWSALPRWRAH